MYICIFHSSVVLVCNSKLAVLTAVEDIMLDELTRSVTETVCVVADVNAISTTGPGE